MESEVNNTPNTKEKIIKSIDNAKKSVLIDNLFSDLMEKIKFNLVSPEIHSNGINDFMSFKSDIKSSELLLLLIAQEIRGLKDQVKKQNTQLNNINESLLDIGDSLVNELNEGTK